MGPTCVLATPRLAPYWPMYLAISNYSEMLKSTSFPGSILLCLLLSISRCNKCHAVRKSHLYQRSLPLICVIHITLAGSLMYDFDLWFIRLLSSADKTHSIPTDQTNTIQPEYCRVPLYTQSNLPRYYIGYCDDSSRTYIKRQTHNSRPIPLSHGRAMGVYYEDL